MRSDTEGEGVTLMRIRGLERYVVTVTSAGPRDGQGVAGPVLGSGDGDGVALTDS